jgi:hypothetical protein
LSPAEKVPVLLVTLLQVGKMMVCGCPPLGSMEPVMREKVA